MGVPIAWGVSFCMLIYGQLRVDYALVQAVLTIIGTNIGTQIQMLIFKRSGGKYQHQILIMIISVIVICVSSASLTVLTIVEKHSQGMPIFRFEAYCSQSDV